MVIMFSVLMNRKLHRWYYW